MDVNGRYRIGYSECYIEVMTYHMPICGMLIKFGDDAQPLGDYLGGEGSLVSMPSDCCDNDKKHTVV